ncbi:hypothetical protein BDV18DRAFT_159248 [Aspergillus unguis]
MLAASNYSMQCLAAPSRAEVDEAHQRKGWLSIGVPNIGGLLLFGSGRRRRLGFCLLVTSLPIHLIYNSAVYFALGPSQYDIAMVNSSRFDPAIREEAKCSELSDVFLSAMDRPDLKEMSKQECLDEFAQDYVYGTRALLLVTGDALSGHPFLSVQSGPSNDFTAKDRSPYGWMCNDTSVCSKEDLENKEAWSLFGTPLSTSKIELAVPGPDGPENLTEGDFVEYLDRPDYARLYDLRDESDGQLRADLSNASLWDNSTWAENVQILGHQVQCDGNEQRVLRSIQSCLSMPAEELCQLVVSPPICIIVICCNAIKLLCILLTARDPRTNVLLTVGDAIASFLMRPDPTTRTAGLLSHDQATKGALGWHEDYIECCYCEKCELRKDKLQPKATFYLEPPKRWMQAASTTLWLSVLLMCAILLSIAGYLLSLGVADLHRYNSSSSIWAYTLGETSTATLITAIVVPTNYTLAMILLANTPQLLVSITYFAYNALLTHMLLAVETNSYATSRKPLRVSYPEGNQRATYYLTLPYMYSVPLIAAAAVLHWLISQSLFYVQIVPHAADGTVADDATVVNTCGYSPQAIVYAMICGGVLVCAALLLGLRRFSSSMPLAMSCSAAISAACHPGSGTAHLEPVQWGELVDSVDVNLDQGSGGNVYLSADEAVRRLDLVGNISGYHCSFTSREVVEPSMARVYT